MQIRTVRKPGDKGTQALMQEYGERLICIRYRYDPANRKRYKTVELIIAEQEWQPPEPHPEAHKPPAFSTTRYTTRRVGVRISHLESDLRKSILAAGGMWDPNEKMWFLPEEEVRRLGLVQRVAKR